MKEKIEVPTKSQSEGLLIPSMVAKKIVIVKPKIKFDLLTFPERTAPNITPIIMAEE